MPVFFECYDYTVCLYADQHNCSWKDIGELFCSSKAQVESALREIAAVIKCDTFSIVCITWYLSDNGCRKIPGW